MKKLDFITPENRTEKMKLFIDNNTLAYYDESGEKHKLLDLKSNDRPVYISELYERLIPALRTRQHTLSKTGYSYIKEQDILIAGTGNDSLLLEQCDFSN